MRNLLRLLREAFPEIIGSIIGGLLVEVILAGIGKQTGVSMWPAIVIIVGCVWLGCTYLAFKRTLPLVEDGKGVWQYPRWRPWARAGMVVICFLTASGVGYYLYQQTRPPTKVIILVANFDGPEPKKYRVTEIMAERLSLALEEYDDVKVQHVKRAFENGVSARSEGEKHKATIVIWGWYGVTEEAVLLSVHFELLRPPKYMPELGLHLKGGVQTATIAELESIALQSRLAVAMTRLSLFTVGMTRYAVEEWQGAIGLFNDALRQTTEHMLGLDWALYFYRGNAYSYKGDFDEAIADYTRSIELEDDHAEVYNNRGVAYQNIGDYNQAIADCSRAIELKHDYAAAYNNCGNAYAALGDYRRAITHYNKAIELDDEYAKAYSNRGIVYGRMGEYDQGIADCSEAIELRPDYAWAYYCRGSIHKLRDEKEEAVKYFERVLELSEDEELSKNAEKQLGDLRSE